jgi:filamentous hemagglutinin family protein
MNMTCSIAAPRSRPRRALLGYTGLCGALAGFAAMLAGPASAQLVQSGVALSSGGLPTIAAASGETDITLHGARTIIDWSTYNVGPGESVHYAFDARNWIVLNRINSVDAPTIAGAIEGRVGGAFGGNIWFSSASGMIFMAGGQIDAGGILITAASADQAGFLNPSNLQFDFSGDAITSSTKLNLQAGSSISGHGGLVALISPTTVGEQMASVNGLAGSSVLYGATNGFTIRLSQGAPGDFDLVDFVIPGSGAGSAQHVAMDLQNTTNASNVFIAAVSRTAAASAIINLEGMITAQSASTDGGDIILSGGGGIVGRLPGPTVSGTIDTDIYFNGASATRDIQLVNSGQVFAVPWARPATTPPPFDPGPFSCSSPFFASLCAPTVTDPSVSLPITYGRVSDPTFVSDLTAGRDLRLVATRTIDLGVAIAARDISIDGHDMLANSLTAGRDLALSTEGGDLNAATVSIGRTGQISAQGAAEVDALALTGLPTAPVQHVAIQAKQNLTFGDGVGAITGSGSITLTGGGNVVIDLSGTARIDSVTAGADALLKAANLNVTTIKGQNVLATGNSVSLGSATAAGDVYVSATGDASVGSAVAGDDIYVLASSGTAALGAAALTGTGADTVGPDFAGNPDVSANGRVISVTSATGDARLTGAVTGATAVTVQAGQDATIDAASLPGVLTVSSGRDTFLRAPTVNLDSVHSGRDLTLAATVGDLTVSTNLVAVHNISLGAAGALHVADIRADSGSITLSGASITGGTLTAIQDLTLRAASGAVLISGYKAGRDLILQGTTLSLGAALAPVGRDLSITALGDFTSTGVVTAARNVSLDVAGKATLAGGAVGDDVHISAADLTLGGTITAKTVEIESRTGALRVGGTAADAAPPSGLWLDNAEFGRIHASTSVSLYAGQTTGGARADLTLLALDVAPTVTPLVNLLAGPTHMVTVAGTAAPTASGGAIRIGDAANAAWRPTSILITGALGAATYTGGAYSNIRAFDDIRLHASQDIIMGSQRFIGLIQAAAPADIELGQARPVGVLALPSEQNLVRIAAGRLELSADGKVVSQNTGTTAGISIGLYLTNKSNPNLIIDPPAVVDLFGVFEDPKGAPVSSFAAGSGVSFVVVDASGNPIAAPTAYKFNSCFLDTSKCTGASDYVATLAQNTPAMGATTDDGEAKSSARGGQRAVTPPLLSNAPPEADEALIDPVTTGAGSEEIWRKRGAKP